MADSKFARAQVIARLAEHLYSYLPGSGAAYTFASAATEAGVPEFWPGGSKKPAITELLTRTLAERSEKFCSLIEAIVLHGISYRAGKTALTRVDLDTLNELVDGLDFKIPGLWDPAFRASLPEGGAPAPVPPPAPPTPSVRQKRALALQKLGPELDALHGETDRQRAGLQLEALLKALFTIFDLDPRPGFRVTGEQIDGSFLLDGDVYLLEAKWEKLPAGTADLYPFHLKVEGKSAFTRGLFLAMNGFTDEGLRALVTGRQANFVAMTGVDLYDVVSGLVPFDALLREKLRHLAETGDPLLSARTAYNLGRLR